MGKKSTLTFTGLLGLVLTYYYLTSIISDIVYVFAPEYYDIMLYLVGIFASLFVLLTFYYALKEKNYPVIVLYIFVILLIILNSVML